MLVDSSEVQCPVIQKFCNQLQMALNTRNTSRILIFNNYQTPVASDHQTWQISHGSHWQSSQSRGEEIYLTRVGTDENSSALSGWSKIGIGNEDGALPLYLWRLPWGHWDEGLCLMTQHPEVRNCQEKGTGTQKRDRQQWEELPWQELPTALSRPGHVSFQLHLFWDFFSR